MVRTGLGRGFPIPRACTSHRFARVRNQALGMVKPIFRIQYGIYYTMLVLVGKLIGYTNGKYYILKYFITVHKSYSL